MAANDIKLTELPLIDLSDLDNNDILYLVDNDTLSKATTLGNIKTFVNNEQTQVMSWKNKWLAGAYNPYDVVTDDGWTMVANKATQDRPAPQPVGSPAFIYEGTLVPVANTAKQIIFGTRYTATTPGYIDSVRVDVTAGNEYTVYLIEDPLGAPVITQVISFVASIAGWTNLNINSKIVGIGTVFDVTVVTNEPAATPVTFLGNWDYNVPNNTTIPVEGVVEHSKNQPGNLLISTTDNDTADRRTELLTLTVGDFISVGNTRWAIQGIVDNTTYFDFLVSPAVNNSTDGVLGFTFETVTSTPITTGYELNYNAGNPNVRGLFIIDGKYGDISANDNQYGVDISIQAAVLSADWDYLASSESSAAGTTAFTPVYLYSKTVNHTVTNDIYEEIGRLTTPLQNLGTYESKLSMTYALNSTNTSSFFRFSNDGGITWNEFRKEPKDNTDNAVLYYSFPIEVTAEKVMDIVVEARKEVVGDVLLVSFLDIIWERKL